MAKSLCVNFLINGVLNSSWLKEGEMCDVYQSVLDSEV